MQPLGTKLCPPCAQGCDRSGGTSVGIKNGDRADRRLGVLLGSRSQNW
jgi:hypothetical protein